jgi:lipopolysaccharide transport system ATP-binding protein
VQQPAADGAVRPGGEAEPRVTIRGLVKRYPLFVRRRDRALAFLGRTAHLAVKTALDGVDLTAFPGEAIGIIGENGSGKSTLLRIVAGISPPSAGVVRADQPVAAILELGLGFHPEFTGRQNALLYGALLGVPEAAMADRLDDVLAFAELGEFVDQPLRTYSSGMAARLAFAVATNVDPKVLVVDEALAVGDGGFQRKCVDRMVRFKEERRTVLFCSHAMYLVAGFCERAIWLHEGKVAGEGPTRTVIHAYEDYLRHRGKRRVEQGNGGKVPAGQLARIVDMTVEPAGGSVAPGDRVAVRLRLRRSVAGLPLHVGISFENENGLPLAVFATLWDGLPPLVGDDDEELTLTMPACPFSRGELDLSAFLSDANGLQLFDVLLSRRGLAVNPRRWEPGLRRGEHVWERS